MGDSKRRKGLGISFEQLEPMAQLSVQAQLYKKDKRYRPDLGMALALIEYTQPLMIGCFFPTLMNDIEWDNSITGAIDFYGNIEGNSLGLPPEHSDGYFFTVAFKKNDRLSLADLADGLDKHTLIVKIEPKYKYLTSNKKEWVVPLVPVDVYY